MGGELLKYILDFVVATAAGAAVFAYWVANRRRIAAETVGRAEEQASRVLRDAEREAETRRKEALLEAKERAHELRLEAEQYARDHRQQITGIEQILTRREAALSEQLAKAERGEAELRHRLADVGERERTAEAAARKYDELVTSQRRELERVSGLTGDEARELLLRHIEGDARRDAANLVKRLEAEAREQAAGIARSIITQAIQRCGRRAHDRDHGLGRRSAERRPEGAHHRPRGPEHPRAGARDRRRSRSSTTRRAPSSSRASIPIGARSRAGSIERLIADGRIHPARIEEVVEKVNAEMEDDRPQGRRGRRVRAGPARSAPGCPATDGAPASSAPATDRTSCTTRAKSPISPASWRASSGSTRAVAVRAAFLHDIGKAIDRDIQGTHLELGLDFLKKHGESEPVLQAVAAHHMDIDWPSLEAMIVQAADAISAARPGARRDILESYIKRLEKLEGIADSFKGVSKSFALQAGREIRIMVESEKVTDEEAIWLSKDIARRIENELEYPGQIKVTVIRETRAVDYAK